MSADSQIPLYLFAKAPVPGKVKTRLQPHLSEQRSAELAQLMLCRIVDTVVRYWPGELILAISPGRGHPVFDQLVNLYGISIVIQRGASLGDRMLNVLGRGISESGSAVVMGCDVPQIGADILQQCHVSLENGRNVAGPATDGGFYLLGLTQFDEHIFEGVVWGGDTVWARLSENASELGLELETLDRLRDIDNWNDLCWLADRDKRYQGFIL